MRMNVAQMQKAWEEGMKLPVRGELNVSPWDALLIEVRRSSYRVEWINQQIELASQRCIELRHEGDENDPAFVSAQTDMRSWINESRKERSHLAKVSKSAIDAGLAAHVVQTSKLEARTIARVLARTLEAAQCTPQQQELAAAELKTALRDVSNNRQWIPSGQIIQDTVAIEMKGYEDK